MNEARLWNQLAARYDVVVRLFDTSYPRVEARLTRDLPSDGLVLEVGAGTGQFTLKLAGAVSKLVATDISPQMVQMMRQRIARARQSNVDCVVMSAYELTAEDACFDAVFCANALHIMARPGRALAEFRRVLRDDGVLISPTFLHGADPFRRALSRVLSAVSPFVAHTRFDRPSLEAALVEAGFEVTQVQVMPGLFPLAYVVARPTKSTSSDLTGVGSTSDTATAGRRNRSWRQRE